MRGFRVWSDYWKKYAFDAELYADGSLYAMFEDDDGVPHHENTDLVLEFDTGLKDKNGEKIYGGDILESTWNGDKAVVVWNNVEGEWEHYADFNAYSKYGGSVVIGNIHENPELLGEEEE